MLNKWKREIKAVGFKDWLWFVFYLRRNEFSHKLSMGRNYIKNMRHSLRQPDGTLAGWYHKLIKNRKRAHDIDDKLSSL